MAIVSLDDYDRLWIFGALAMSLNLASFVLLLALIATIVPPGYSAYIGAYVAIFAALVAFAIYGWKERTTMRHPTAVAILSAIALITSTLPFVSKGPQDFLGPVFILPMFTTLALGILARPSRWVPGPTLFAALCLFAVTLALVGGLYERFVLDLYRPGMGNNPIHFATLAAITGNLSLIGVVSGRSRWRYLFLLGPLFGIGATMVADSRGPMAGALAMSGAGLVTLTIWLWRESVFRWSLTTAMLASVTIAALIAGTGNYRVLGLVDTALRAQPKKS